MTPAFINESMSTSGIRTINRDAPSFMLKSVVALLQHSTWSLAQKGDRSWRVRNISVIDEVTLDAVSLVGMLTNGAPDPFTSRTEMVNVTVIDSDFVAMLNDTNIVLLIDGTWTLFAGDANTRLRAASSMGTNIYNPLNGPPEL